MVFSLAGGIGNRNCINSILRILKSKMSKPIEIRSREAQGAEVSWFAPICDGDDRYLGERDVKYKSNWENTSNILLTADQLGYRNILCPSSYQVGQDTLPLGPAVSY